MSRLVAMLALLALVSAAAINNLNEEAETKNRPVTKVINMLKDMIEQLEKEGEEDEEIYEQMGCWCTTNEKEKTKAIADAEENINQLSSAIEELSANSARLNTEVAMLNKEVAKNDDALDSATSLREKQLAEFNLEEKDMIASITSLKGAVIALSKHHQASFLQVSTSASESMPMTASVTVKHLLEKYHDLLSEVITPRKRKLAMSLMQVRAPQSGAIFGILKAMKESFETNLAQSQKEESENNKAFLDLKAAKEKEVKAGSDQSETKTQELATTDEKNAESKQSLDDTRNTLAADTEYLSNLKAQCQNVDHAYEERTKTRQLEIKATSEALAFLSSDEAHDLFTSTFNPALIQKESSLQAAQRAQAVKVMSIAAKSSGDMRLSKLARRTRGLHDTGSAAAFDAVKKTIQQMVDSLVEEKKEEIKKRDFCIEEITANEDDTTSKKRDKADLVVAIEDLKQNIDQLTREIEELKEEIKEAEIQLERAGKDREKENQEFKVVVADQRATGKLLKVALEILKGFYDKAALLQTSSLSKKQPAGPPPPPGFKTYEKSASSGGVMGMMQSIIDDAKAMEEEALRGEKESQEEYESFVKETNESIDAMNLAVTNKGEAKSKAESAKVEREQELEAVIGEIDALAAASADLHKDCDYTIKNFEMRQGARDDEIDALRQAIAIFSGASFSGFLQYKLP